MTLFYKVMRAIVSFFTHIFFRIKKYGVHNIPKEGAVILCCNHTSISDILFMGILCPRQIYFMGKDELFKNKILAFILKKLGAFSVNRRTGDKGAINKAEELLLSGKILGIFPEGTRYTDGGAPRKAKAGTAMLALATKAPILPCAVYRDTGKVKPFQKATFRFGAPIYYDEYAGEDTGKAAIRRVSGLITEKITELWEMKH